MKRFFYMKYWYTDLSEDSKTKYFMCHLDYGISLNGNPKVSIRKGFTEFNFYKIRLTLILIKTLINRKSTNY